MGPRREKSCRNRICFWIPVDCRPVCLWAGCGPGYREPLVEGGVLWPGIGSFLSLWFGPAFRVLITWQSISTVNTELGSCLKIKTRIEILRRRAPSLCLSLSHTVLPWHTPLQGAQSRGAITCKLQTCLHLWVWYSEK